VQPGVLLSAGSRWGNQGFYGVGRMASWQSQAAGESWSRVRSGLVVAWAVWSCSAAATDLRAADLPPELVAVKQQIIAIASANTTKLDNIDAVRAQLNPLVAQLETWFNANRPANEVALTQVAWKNLWYDDPDISFDLETPLFGFRLDREQIYQVVRDGYYYNVSETELRLGPVRFTLQNFLKGEYTILRPADANNVGQPRLNTVDLEFTYNGVWFGKISRRIPLTSLVERVDAGRFPAIAVPGPLGQTGELWNAYVDGDLRIAAGFNDNDPETIDVYVLTKVTNAK
jgi:hypothetical protein